MRKLAAPALAFLILLPASAMAQAPSFTLVNRTGQAIIALNVSPASAERWSPDLLRAAPVANGGTVRISVPRSGAACSFDLRFSYAGGDTSELQSVNLCEARTITVSTGEDEEETTEVAAVASDGSFRAL